MRAMTFVAFAALCGASMALGGCGGSSTGSVPAVAPTSTQADDEAATDVVEHHRHHHHGGVTMFIAMSLDTLGVDPAQRAAVEKIQAELRAKMEPARVAEQNVLTILADGIAAGTIDTAKVDAAIAQVTSATGGLHDATADALNQLHAVLTPEQRAALVDKVQAHWAIWRHANGEEQATPGGSPGGEHLGMLAKELGLSPDQIEKVRANMSAAVAGSRVRPDPQAVEAHMQAFAAAFKSDAFDAKSLTTASAASSHLASWGATRMAHFFESVNPVLTPDQRAKLSQELREHLNHEEGTASL
ncbi:MAG: Spy/CpxP family protein refolding chaperone [Polyangiaceae bacterium]|jgi:Spy/CpxP family protein refolding chaperone